MTNMFKEIVKRLFSGIPRLNVSGRTDEARAQHARCRFIIDKVHQNKDLPVILTGLVVRGRLYHGQVLELVGFGLSESVVCAEINHRHASVDNAYVQTGHQLPFALTFWKGDPAWFKAGQVLAGPGTTFNVLELRAMLSITSEPGSPNKMSLTDGFVADVRFAKDASVRGTVRLPVGQDAAQPGTSVEMCIQLAEALPFEVGDEIRLNYLGSPLAEGRVTEVTPADPT